MIAKSSILNHVCKGAKLSMTLTSVKSKLSCSFLFCPFKILPTIHTINCRRAQMQFYVVSWEKRSANLVCTSISIVILTLEIIELTFTIKKQESKKIGQELRLHVMGNKTKSKTRHMWCSTLQNMSRGEKNTLIKWDVRSIHSLLCLPAKKVGSYIKDVLEHQGTCLDSLDMT